MTTTIINYNLENLEDQMLIMSQFYSPPTRTPPQILQQGEGDNSKPKRRRRKSKGKDINNKSYETRKRKLSEDQVKLLEMYFGDEHKLASERKDKLAMELGLDPRQVAVWFQNRRAKWKTKKLEEEYTKLKIEYESSIADNCRLQSDVSKLKEQLCEAEKRIQHLIERVEGVSINSPSSSALSVEATTNQDNNTQLTGQFGVVDYDNMLLMATESNYINGMDWSDFNYM